MVELELVGRSDDGTMLVLADAAGDEFVVPLDARLRAVVRGDRARTGQLETQMDSAQKESTLRPRDIQARIRAGEDPEAVAVVAQVPVDRIMGYAVPVIAERQHVAERAQRCAVRRKHADGPGQLLGDAVAERLRARDVDPGDCGWDAWRREDGRWTVAARFRGDGRDQTATFVYDALSRYAVADDDTARALVGERVESEPESGTGRARGPAQQRASGRRLSAVSSEYDASLFDDEDTTDLTAVADVLGREERGEQPPRHDGGEYDEPAARTASDEGPRQQQPKPEKRGRRGRGRASVPSWDEIMFGQPKG